MVVSVEAAEEVLEAVGEVVEVDRLEEDVEEAEVAPVVHAVGPGWSLNLIDILV